jgi:hypothetical protein
MPDTISTDGLRSYQAGVAIFHAGGLDKPGGGYLYLTALEKVATYIPEASMARLQAGD